MDYDIGMGIATFKIVLLLHIVIQTLFIKILTENYQKCSIYHYLCIIIRKFGRIYDTSGRG